MAMPQTAFGEKDYVATIAAILAEAVQS